MARNHVAPGEHFLHTAQAAVAAGDGVLMGATLGVSLNSLAAGQAGAVAVQGVWRVPKLAGDNIAQGAICYWDNGNKRVTLSATGNTVAGRAYTAAAAGTAQVELLLNV